ncbi:MAG: aspartate aminotransferase family protein [Endomicrobium sp.]|jgi:4-aminobutyrate aminotransferase/(S)-3-amino-2-methylpropionate transaminase|nr:aspartate aminotransferase family protein [Endomicrobium sp.]
MKISSNMSNIIAKEKKFLSSGVTPAYTIAPRIFSYGKGVKLYDIDGNEYYDFSSGVVTNSTGNCHPRVVEFMKDRIGEVWNIYDYGTPYRIKLFEEFKTILPEHIDTFEFYSTGSEAVEAGLRALYSSMKLGKKKICTVVRGFHGKTAGSRELIEWCLEGELQKDVYRIHYPDCYRCPLNMEKLTCNDACLKQAEEILTNSPDIGALVLEPILGSGGAIKPTYEYFDKIKKICEEKNILIFADEFCLGFGRTGKDFAFQHFNLEPDLIVFSKGMASGLPFSVIGGRKKIMNKKPFGLPGYGSSTYGSNPLSIAAAYITIQVYKDEKLCENVVKLTPYFKEWLENMKNKYYRVGSINIAGFYGVLDFVKNRISKIPDNELGMEVYKQCMELGVKAMAFNHLFKIIPPLVITKEELIDGLNIIDKAIDKAIKVLY